MTTHYVDVPCGAIEPGDESITDPDESGDVNCSACLALVLLPELPCGCRPHRTRMSHFGTALYCETEQNAYCNFECPHDEEN